MSGVFRNINPPPPHRPASVYLPPPAPMVRGEDTLAGWKGGSRVNSSEDARHCSALYMLVLCDCSLVPGVHAQ
jgi:hypothetical protein